ncbi:acyl-CoA dehydrogenase [Schinkia azotoformans MEV2011]|uniref:Acyl-CoA dehydrogenase n=1 Tax=Schinkia azotoformans MEV2011 TaxID=1348973 RepID=A0A072NPR8_SCHAZ|nr:acyl-CoA dehydrogenase family protein [Schinkia azotoformans]KEF38918.1 acyl-CoA dehydrogenase [Schinkia azotoformans MEV2011]MEC1694517.1 acyl-CoA dehydrogenase family protein [Schinkia azotoformans]MEC1714556.1 acyl-CoA dehydrogenase family protein [Schinkia azotoformans]MEC1723327.1 acyl-CoA dehydrogenase family protein [Schinkia azotoformans]MEC1740350.1 acyl-CoA dehydrogenase family protein [Schinkia azotoformans]
MDFKLSDEQLAIRAMTRDFVNNEIMPVARMYDEEETFPTPIFDKLREYGLFNLAIPEEYGGPGVDKISQALIVEEVARGCAGISTSMEANSLSSYPILVGGSEELKKKYLTRLTNDGEYAAFALTEPQGGSDVMGTKTTIERVGDEYVINGEKCFITNASYAHFFVVLAKMKGEKGPNSFIAIVVERDTEGLSVGPKEKKMGLKASNTASVMFDNVRVPVSNRIGEEGEGFKIFMKALSFARPMVGAQSVGLAQGAYEEAVKFAKERKQFGTTISNFQAIQFMLADMAMNIEAARLLVYKAVYLLQEGTPSITNASFAKCFASDTAMKVATDAVQIHGGYGFIREYPVEKYFRDAKIQQIYEGTNQIQRVVIAKEILKD